MLTDTIREPKHPWSFRDPRIKAVADKAKAEGYRVWLNKDSTCYPQGSYGFIANEDGSKLVYFQLDTFNMYVDFSVELVPSTEFGSAYGIGDESLTTVEKINEKLSVKELFDCAKPQIDRNKKVHELYTLRMKQNDYWGLRDYVEY